MKKIVIFILLCITLFLLFIVIIVSISRKTPSSQSMASTSINSQPNMTIISSTFVNNGKIPPKYTCDGQNINPSLIFSNIPPDTKSLVLVVDDPDAPNGLWTHWIVFNIDPATREIEENHLPSDSQLGINSFGSLGYGGPCPPQGASHRYFFRLFALNSLLSLASPNRQTIDLAMKNKIIASAELVGIYR